MSLPRGFRPVYRYTFANGVVLSEKILDHKLWKQRGIVYARVCDGVVVYVGKADGTLGGRIRRHIRLFPKAAEAKAKAYRKHIAGKVVTTYAYRPRPIRLFGLDVPVHGSLECALIKKYKRPLAEGWFVERGG
jgi:hypothetical protein